MLKQINYAKSVAALLKFQAAVRRDAAFVLLVASDFTLQTSLAGGWWRLRDCVSLTAERLRVFGRVGVFFSALLLFQM